MEPVWQVALLVLGAITAVNLVLLLLLIRQYGLLLGRLGPAGARMTNEGPEPGARVDLSQVAARAGASFPAAGSGKPLLLYFLDPGCRTCKEMLSAAKSVDRSEPWLDQVIVALRAPADEHWADEVLTSVPVVVGPDIAAELQIAGGPFVLAIDGRREVRAKGIVNTKEDVDSLISLLDDMIHHRHAQPEEIADAAVAH